MMQHKDRYKKDAAITAERVQLVSDDHHKTTDAPSYCHHIPRQTYDIRRAAPGTDYTLKTFRGV